jgi:hypothetical protein
MARKSIHWLDNMQDLKNQFDELRVNELIVAYDAVPAGNQSIQSEKHIDACLFLHIQRTYSVSF